MTNLPTPVDEMSGAMGSLVVSVGQSSGGVLSTSYASHANFEFPSYNLKAGMKLLSLSSEAVTVNRGTYSKEKFCVLPAVGRFSESAQFSITSSSVDLVPNVLSAALGDDMTCGMLGAAVTSQVSTYLVYWLKEGGESYTDLPSLSVEVGSSVSIVNVASEVTCALGGRSVPIIITSDAIPHTDITIRLGIMPYDKGVENAVDPSIGLKPDNTVVILSLA